MSRKVWLAAALLALLLTLCLVRPIYALPMKDYFADQVNENIAIQNDGSLLITEAITFQFIGGPFTYVYRDIPTNKTDNITIIRATMSDTVMQPGQGPGHYEVDEGDPLKVTWHFAPIYDSIYEFTLTYRVQGVVQKTSSADVLDWIALPDDTTYTIRTATITFTYSALAQLQGQPLELQGPDTTFTQTYNSISFTAQDVDPDTILEYELDFSPGSIISAAPHWQQVQERANALWPFTLPGALIVALLISIAVWRYKRSIQPRVTLPAFYGVSAAIKTPPDELSPTISGVMVQGTQTGQANFNQVLGTMLDLANRGVLTIQAGDQSSARTPNYTIERLTHEGTFNSYERVLLKMMFTPTSKQPNSTRFSRLQLKYMGTPSRFNLPVKQEMQARGLLDENYEPLRRHLGLLNMLLLIVGSAGILITSIAGASNGNWPFALLFIGLLIAAIVTQIMRNHCRIFSVYGLQRAQNWKAFDNYLQNIAFSRTEIDLDQATAQEIFERYLPFAASFGHGDIWIVHFQRLGLAIPPAWFSILPTKAGAPRQPKLSDMERLMTPPNIAFNAPQSTYGGRGGYRGGFGGGFGGGGGAAGGGGSGAG